MKDSELSVRSSVAILAAWGALMKLSFARQKAREKQVEEDCGVAASKFDRSLVLLPERACSWRDHPLAAWSAENGCVWLQALSGLAIFGPPNAQGSLVEKIMSVVIGGLWKERLALLCQYFVVNHLYSHHKFFDKNGAPTYGSVGELLWEFMCVTFAAQSAFLFLPTKKNEKARKALSKWTLSGDIYSFRPLAFCAKLAIVRSVVDILFWIGHYLIHLPQTYFIHKTHHEHVHPHVFTNQHFSVSDLYIEALFPMLSAVALLKSRNVKLSQLEISLLSSYVFWLEGMSHAGKPMPASTMVAPLAPLYHLILGNIDRRNVEFHHYHHQALRCNYSITPWFDHLVGTTRFYPPAYNKRKPSAKEDGGEKDFDMLSLQNVVPTISNATGNER